MNEEPVKQPDPTTMPINRADFERMRALGLVAGDGALRPPRMVPQRETPTPIVVDSPPYDR